MQPSTGWRRAGSGTCVISSPGAVVLETGGGLGGRAAANRQALRMVSGRQDERALALDQGGWGMGRAHICAARHRRISESKDATRVAQSEGEVREPLELNGWRGRRGEG